MVFFTDRENAMLYPEGVRIRTFAGSVRDGVRPARTEPLFEVQLCGQKGG